MGADGDNKHRRPGPPREEATANEGNERRHWMHRNDSGPGGRRRMGMNVGLAIRRIHSVSLRFRASLNGSRAAAMGSVGVGEGWPLYSTRMRAASSRMLMALAASASRMMVIAMGRAARIRCSRVPRSSLDLLIVVFPLPKGPVFP